MLLVKLDHTDLQSENMSKFDGAMVYAQNKRQQVVMTERWADRYPNIYFASMHPGKSTFLVHSFYCSFSLHLLAYFVVHQVGLILQLFAPPCQTFTIVLNMSCVQQNRGQIQSYGCASRPMFPSIQMGHFSRTEILFPNTFH